MPKIKEKHPVSQTASVEVLTDEEVMIYQVFSNVPSNFRTKNVLHNKQLSRLKTDFLCDLTCVLVLLSLECFNDFIEPIPSP